MPGVDERTCAGVDLVALRDAACSAAVKGELFLSAERRLNLELEARTGAFTTSTGESLWASARVQRVDGVGMSSRHVSAPGELSSLLEGAAAAAPMAGALPEPLAPGAASSPVALPALSRVRAQAWAARVSSTVVPRTGIVQALVLSQSETWTAHVLAGASRAHVESREEVFVRCETERGAVVDAVALGAGQGAHALEALRSRLAEAFDALEGPVDAVDPALPLVLRPAVAAPLVAGLVWMLRGDVAAATPALARALGRKLFPSVLGLEDDAAHPQGTRRRALDDEGMPMHPVRLVDEGRLSGFLHTASTAPRLGGVSNGRALRSMLAGPTPNALNPFVMPRADPLPAHYTELIARVETFTTMPRPGTVTLVAGGWEVRDGRRVRRIAPVELELPVLETFRALRGVGTDLTFFPTAEGCGTPTLVFPPLLSGAQGGQAAR
ncbi:TldD/PmbA family protein [Myxococcus xanthus]|uniref:TldD/PmbA family protein n=1 Tax=Myxococcus xanthus TaxID=34 RepID=A0AAE6G7D9_MYXXA|nr:metallopeptidase TldD-related protein [Myxococcus xanthus]QDE72334.1 TldD/PmbA family protein [Myxococcus xanthus]QDE79617.1 TldD/PmbA family protein [Myxococcus xanthus]